MPATTERIHVVIVDDHRLFREAVRDILNSESDIRVTGEAGSPSEAVEVVRSTRPQVVLLDIEMPGSQPFSTVLQVREASPQSHVLVLSMHDDPSTVQDMLSLDIRGYLHKTIGRHELAAAIRGVQSDPKRIFVAVSSRDSVRTTPDADPNLLSEREREVLTLVAQALSNRQIAARLSITEGTVKRHLRNIFGKLDAVSRIDAVNKAIAESLIAPDRGQPE